jgi:hypothetical protein
MEKQGMIKPITDTSDWAGGDLAFEHKLTNTNRERRQPGAGKREQLLAS